MARTDLSVQSPTAAGITVSFSTFATGANNGFKLNPRAAVRLKNPTVGTATFTVDTPGQPGGLDIAQGSFTLAPAAEKMYDLSNAVYEQTDGKVYIDCDVAAQAASVQTNV